MLPHALVPLLVVAFPVLAWALHGAGVPWPTAVGGTVVGAGAGLFLAERRWPHTDAWRLTARAARVDGMHVAFTALAVVPALEATVGVVCGTWAAGLVAATGVSPWPASWPLGAQVVLAVAVADLGAYAAHRFMHATDVGWRAHAVHHSATALHVLASGRTHPLNVLLTYGAETGLLVLLGVPAPVLALWSVIKATNGLLQHANVAFAPGWASALLVTPEVHRWHHGLEPSTPCNFGNTTTVWDRLFGTLPLPADRPPGVAVGIAGADIPEAWTTHLVAPFVLKRFER